MAKENPSWGFDRIQGALANVGHHISDTTVGNVLKPHGIEPAPDRKRQTSWATFLKALRKYFSLHPKDIEKLIQIIQSAENR